MSRRMPWLKRKKTAPELPMEPPIRLGNMSNGEFFHESTPREQRIRAEILRQADERSRKLGMDRREFLASAMGMCTSLAVVNQFAACSSPSSGKKPDTGFIDMGASGARSTSPMSGGIAGSSGGVAGARAGTMTGAQMAAGGVAGRAGSPGASMTGDVMSMPMSGSGGMRSSAAAGSNAMTGGSGGFMIPEDAMMNCDVAEDVLDGNEFIMDCQTHHIEQEGSWRMTNPTQALTLATYFSQYNGCMEADLTNCIDAQAYLQHIFLESDTDVAVLSGYPAEICTDGRTTGCGNPLDNDAMWMSRDRFNALSHSQRIVNHCQVNPTDNLPLQLAIMERIKNEHNCWGFKSYPEWGPADQGGKGWMLDDPNSGIKMIEKAIELNSKIICFHKGIVFPGWDAACSDPKDAGVVAKMYPDVAFVCYHSAIELDAAGEGVYNANNTQGTDRLCRTFEQNGLKGKNLYAELGSCWAQVMNSPEKAQHVIGKLLKYAGEDNIVWGSECIWLGSPQSQIEAFRTFQISKEFQDMYQYPEITPQARAKIFGLNAARIYGIDVAAKRCKIKETKLAQLKDLIDNEQGKRRWSFNKPLGPTTWREWMNLRRLNPTNNSQI